MKNMGRNRDKEEVDRLIFRSNIKESSCRILRFIGCLVVFVAGVVIGLVSSSHVERYLANRSDLLLYKNHVMSAAPIIIENNCTVPQQQSCEKIDCLIPQNVFRPPDLWHSLPDEVLFWRASMVPKIKEYPYNRVPKVAFMFLTRGPLPLLPLWERFFKGHEKLFSIYIHTPPTYHLSVSIDSIFFGCQIPSKEVLWGDISMADAERRLLANALLDISNERFVLLSDSCIPVYNFQTVYKYLTGSRQSFVEAFDDPSRYGRGRYSWRMSPNIGLHHWRKGSQWFEMNRDLAVSLISDSEYYDLFRRYCRPSCYPDEHYIPTYLNMFHGALNSNRSVTWVDWSMGGPHPATFGSENITEGFIQSIRNNGTRCSYNFERTHVCYLFARKFGPSALEPLLSLSSTVMEL